MARDDRDSTASILSIDDNPGDVRLIEEAVKQCGRPRRFFAVSSGEEALAFLRREGRYKDAPRPQIMLLDLNMPEMTGLEFLAVVKNDPDLKSIPVLVLTSSASARDVGASYAAHANCYFVKPPELNRLFELVRSIETCWLEDALLPP